MRDQSKSDSKISPKPPVDASELKAAIRSKGLTNLVQPLASSTAAQENLYDLELFIAKLLRVGVLVAGLLMLVGWLLDIQFTENPFIHFANYHPQAFIDSVLVMWKNAEWGHLICYAGLIALISLPMIRVLMTAVLFVKSREYVMAGLAGFVLAALLLSFALGFEL